MVYLGPLGPVTPEGASEQQDPVKALLPEDRAWLTKHGWRDTSNDYPAISTERITEA